MAKVISACIRLWGTPENITHHRVEVTVEETDARCIYQKIEVGVKPHDGYLYRGQSEDLYNIFYYSKPGRGFQGSTYHLILRDGSTDILVGPSSSSAGVINATYESDEHLFECVTKKHTIVSYVTIEKLKSYGFKFNLDPESSSSYITYKLSDQFLKQYAKEHPEMFWNHKYNNFNSEIKECV